MHYIYLYIKRNDHPSISLLYNFIRNKRERKPQLSENNINEKKHPYQPKNKPED